MTNRINPPSVELQPDSQEEQNKQSDDNGHKSGSHMVERRARPHLEPQARTAGLALGVNIAPPQPTAHEGPQWWNALSPLRAWIAIALVLGVSGYFGFVNPSRAAAFCQVLFAIVASASVAFIFERARRPKISIVAETPLPIREDGRRFLRVHVRNAATHWLMEPFADRLAASASAWIVFLRDDGSPFFGPDNNMRGRWANTPEPCKSFLLQSPESPHMAVPVLVHDMTRTRDIIDISPGSYEPLDIVVASRGQPGCFGWHNEIIQNPRPTRTFVLPAGNHYAIVVVVVAGRRFRQCFRIVNEGDIEHFKLEPVAHGPQLHKDHPLAGDS